MQVTWPSGVGAIIAIVVLVLCIVFVAIGKLPLLLAGLIGNSCSSAPTVKLRPRLLVAPVGTTLFAALAYLGHGFVGATGNSPWLAGFVFYGLAIFALIWLHALGEEQDP